MRDVTSRVCSCLIIAGLSGLVGCRSHMPHSATWPAGGDQIPSHAKPPEGGYYSNWDPFSVELEVTPAEDLNPVRTQHVMIATVLDENGEALPNRRVEWMIAEGSVGDIVEVDESGWRASRGYKVTNKYAVSHTNNFAHVLDLGNDDPSDDIYLEPGQTWCVITSPVEGTSHVTVYAPGIYDWAKHKVFVKKHWYDVQWQFPPPATNPAGTSHVFETWVARHSDGTPLEGYDVTYKILDGPDATLTPGGGETTTVKTDASGVARVTIQQARAVAGLNNVSVEIVRPENPACCTEAVQIASGQTSKAWVMPEISISKDAPAQRTVNEAFNYAIQVANTGQAAATNVVVTDTLPDGIVLVSSSPKAEVNGQTLTWSLGSLEGGQERSISVTVKGTRSGVFENCARVNAGGGLTDDDCATTKITAPALVIEKLCPTEVLLCDPIRYQIVVRNEGDGDAHNVNVVDTLPGGLVTESGSSSITFNVGMLQPGQSKKMRFSAKAERPGRFSNRVVATADGDLMAEATCQTVVRQPVLTVTKQGPAMRYLGRSATFEITVKNDGDAPAQDTVLVDTLPANATLREASEGGRTSGNRVTWRLGALAPGDSKTVSVTIQPSRIGSYHNTAKATAVCAEGSASADLEVRGISAILLEVVDVEDPIEIGTNVTYVITVTNQGSAEGTNINVVCQLPSEQELVSTDGPTKAAANGKKVTFAPLATLAPGATATYRLVAKGVKEGDVRFHVQMKSDQMSSPVDETESTHIY